MQIAQNKFSTFFVVGQHKKLKCRLLVEFLWSPSFGQYSTSFLRRFFWSFLFLSLARINKVCPLPSTKSPIIIAISFAILEQSRVILSFVLRAKPSECVASWFAVTPPLLKWLTEQNNPFEVCKRAARYNEFGFKSRQNKTHSLRKQTTTCQTPRL